MPRRLRRIKGSVGGINGFVSGYYNQLCAEGINNHYRALIDLIEYIEVLEHRIEKLEQLKEQNENFLKNRS